MSELVQLLVSGVAVGAIYALAALGFTLLWQASGTINFAQGEFVMLPAFAMLFCIAAGAPLWLAFLVTCAAAMLILGWGFKCVIVDPLIRHGVIPLVIATLGLSIALKTLYGRATARRRISSQPLPRWAVRRFWHQHSYADVGTLLIAGVIVVALQMFVTRTVTGARCRRSPRTPMPRACSASMSSGWCSTRS